MTTTYAIATVVKNEHDYIGQFVEYHWNLGFTHFYILVDNIIYEEPNYQVCIDEKYLKHITFYYLDKSFDPKYYNDIINNKRRSSHYWIAYFNKHVLPIIKEDWILIIGLDSFMYFDGKSVNEYMLNANIRPETTQIAFPWCVVENMGNKRVDYFCEEITDLYVREKPWDHSYTMGKVSKIKNLNISTHGFFSKDDEQLIYICDNTYMNAPSDVNVWDIFKKIQFSILHENHPKNYSIHFMFRNYDEIIIKDFFYFRNAEPCLKSDSLRKLIINKEFSQYRLSSNTNRLGRVLDSLKEKYVKVPFKLNNNFKLTIPNKHIYTKNIIKQLLEANDITQEQYDSFINDMVQLFKSSNT